VERAGDRHAVVDVVIAYATGVDRRDWERYRACFTDPCEIDFSSWSGRPAAWMAADDWVRRVRSTNGNFDATQHLSSNHVVTFTGDDAATCVSEMQAQHWFSAERLAALGHASGGEAHWCTLGGHYTNHLVRAADGWRIERCRLDVRWVTGDRSVFDIARSLGDPLGRRG
jgi:SnoaL-like domain